MRASDSSRGVAVLGSSGYLGQKVVSTLARQKRPSERILALDVREVAPGERLAGVDYEVLDVRSARLQELLADNCIGAVVHLAAIAAPAVDMTCQEQYAIDVDGTHNVLEACKETGVRHLTVLSSGAVYGSTASGTERLAEDAPLLGDGSLYLRHKRLVEELLARYRTQHPSLPQLVFRPAIALGRGTRNPIADFLARAVLFDIMEAPVPFSFILDDDLVACVVKGVHEERSGIFNVAADGEVGIHEIARLTGARRVTLRAGTLRRWVRALRFCHLTKVTPEQVSFLQHRPLLANEALKREFGFMPTMTSREVFETWWSARRK